MNSNFSAQAVALTAMTCATVSTAHAEGSFSTHAASNMRGVFGANRRIITDQPAGTQGYRAVKGTFTVPTVRVILRNISSGLAWPFYPSSSTYQNLADSKPTFYLGCSQTSTNTQVDAGAQYYALGLPFTNGQGENVYAPPGWGVFVFASRQGQHLYPDNTGNGWRARAKYEGLGVLPVSEFQFQWVAAGKPLDGYRGYLDVHAEGMAPEEQPGIIGGYSDAPPNSGRLYAIGSGILFQQGTGIVGLRVKRVVGITQAGSGTTQSKYVTQNSNPNADNVNDYEEDGSYLRGCRFYNGYVSVTATPNPFGWQPWSNIPIDQDRTGYTPDGLDKTNRTTGTHATGAKLHIDFPSLPPADRDNQLAVSRYDDETVDINLRKYIPSTGLEVGPGESSITQE